MKNRNCHNVSSITLIKYANTCVKTLPTLLLPNGSEGMREVCVFMLVALMARSGLDVEKYTRTLSLVLAISRGLQMVIEMNPPSNPAMKLTRFWSLMWWLFYLFIDTLIIFLIIYNYWICTIHSGWESASPTSSDWPPSAHSDGHSPQVSLISRSSVDPLPSSYCRRHCIFADWCSTQNRHLRSFESRGGQRVQQGTKEGW